MRVFKIAVICSVLILTLTGCDLFKTKINLEEYIVYSYEGINEYASIQADIDSDKIKADFQEKIKAKHTESFNQLVDSLTTSLTKSTELVNGDEVIINVEYSEELMEASNVVFENNQKSVVIEGLQEGELLELFNDITVQVSGIAPMTDVNIINNSTNPYIMALDYEADAKAGFRAGDVLNIICNIDVKKANEDGYVVLHTSKPFSTAGIKQYVMEASDIDYDSLSFIATSTKAAIDLLTEDTQTRMLYKVTGASNYLFQYNKEWIDSASVEAAKLLVTSDRQYHYEGDNRLAFNKLILIFKTYVTNADHGNDGYFAFVFNDVIKNADNTLSTDMDNMNLRYVVSDTYEGVLDKLSVVMTELYEVIDIPIQDIVIS